MGFGGCFLIRKEVLGRFLKGFNEGFYRVHFGGVREVFEGF